MALAKIRSSNRPGLGLACCALNASDQFWNTTINAGAGGFEAYNAANIAAYGLPLTEIGSTGVYSGAVPAGISIADIYSLPVYIKAAGAGGSLVAGDLTSGPIGMGDLDWTGSVVASVNRVESRTEGLPSKAVQVEDSVNDTGATTTVCKGSSALSATDDFYVKARLLFTSGSNLGASPRQVKSYLGATRQFTFKDAWPNAPANGDTFIIIGGGP